MPVMDRELHLAGRAEKLLIRAEKLLISDAQGWAGTWG